MVVYYNYIRSKSDLFLYINPSKLFGVFCLGIRQITPQVLITLSSKINDDLSNFVKHGDVICHYMCYFTQLQLTIRPETPRLSYGRVDIPQSWLKIKLTPWLIKSKYTKQQSKPHLWHQQDSVTKTFLRIEIIYPDRFTTLNATDRKWETREPLLIFNMWLISPFF